MIKAGRFIIISGPSGVGKTTIVNKLLEQNIPNLTKLVTCTTRKPRDSEKSGIHYHFWPKERFEAAITNRELLEHEEIYGNYYGTPKKELMKQLETSSVIASLGIEGVKSVKSHKDISSLAIIIKPPSMEELRKRLTTRNVPANEIETRLNRAKNELSSEQIFDASFINDDLETTVKNIKNYILHNSGTRA